MMRVSRLGRVPVAVAAGALCAGLLSVVPVAVSAAPAPVQTPKVNCTLKTPIAQAYCASVTYAGPAKIVSLDPATPRVLVSYQAGYASQGLLWRFNKDLQPKMDLVEKETVSKDGLTVTSTLRANAKYNDGSPVTAADAVLGFERWRDSKQSASFIAKIVSATAIDSRTIVWKFNSPFPEFPYAMAVGILTVNPADRVKANPEAYFRSPVSAGPLYVKSWTPGADDIVLAANPAYWAKAQVGEATFRATPDPAARQLALEAGTIQYVLDLPIAASQTLKNPAIRVYAHQAPGTFTLTSNMVREGSPIAGAGSGKFNRQAISAAINREQIGQVAFFGLMRPACTQFFQTGNPYFRCSLPNDGKQDLKLARELLAKAGNPNGFTFELNPWARAGWVEAANIIAANLKEVGITANVVPQADAVAIANANSGNFQMQFTGNNAATPILQMQNWFAPGGFWTTAGRVVDPVITAALDRAASSTNPATIKKELYVANRLSYDSSAHIPVGDRFWVSGSRLPDGVLQAVKPGDLYMYVGTLPSIDTRPGVEDRVYLTK